MIDKWSSISISLRIFQFVVIHAVNEAEVDVCLEPPCFFHGPTNVGNLISGFSAFSRQLLHLKVLGSRTVEA